MHIHFIHSFYSITATNITAVPPYLYQEDQPQILGGRDALVGSTWLACTRGGKLAFLTIVQELESSKCRSKTTRGDLPVRFLQSEKGAEEFADELVAEGGDQYNGFNLIVADLSSMSMFYITNRPKSKGTTATRVSPGIHVLSKARLDTPWPKALRLEKSFRGLMNRYRDREISIEVLNEEAIMNDRTKDEDESKLPHICAVEWEYHMSSIFVDTEMPMGPHGTRSTSTLTVKWNGSLTFSEGYFGKDGGDGDQVPRSVSVLNF